MSNGSKKFINIRDMILGLQQKNHASQETQLLHDNDEILPDNQLLADMLGKDILLVMAGTQFNILGQVFRPIFTGTVAKVTNGYLTLDPVIIKMNTAPFYKFPTQLSFPLEKITYFAPFDSDTKFSIP